MNRLLRVEARRNAVPPLLPLALLLLWLTPLAQHLRPVALWTDRSTDLQSAVQAIGPFTAAAAAWAASREHRRAMSDLLASTPYAPWRRWSATWAATCGWAVLFYAAVGVALFAVTAVQATWGHPVVWPVLSGLASVTACTTVGFAAGRLVPGRVTTPLAAVGVFFVMAFAMETALHGATSGMLSPLYPSIGLASSVFYAVRPDLTYVQVACYLGVTVAALGALTLRDHGGSRTVRRTGTAISAGGLALVAAAFALISTGHRDGQGVVVPALHDAATDRAVPYTPVCTRSAIPVCLHPAYAAAGELTTFDTTVNAIAAPLAGLPGTPVRAEQHADDKGRPGSVLHGDPPVLSLPDFIVHGHTLRPAGFAAAFRTRIALALVTPAGTVPTLTPSRRAAAGSTTLAQRAAALALLTRAAYPPDTGLIPPDAAVETAARRLAALAPARRRAWFARHLAALRAGTLTLTELP